MKAIPKTTDQQMISPADAMKIFVAIVVANLIRDQTSRWLDMGLLWLSWLAPLVVAIVFPSINFWWKACCLLGSGFCLGVLHAWVEPPVDWIMLIFTGYVPIALFQILVLGLSALVVKLVRR